MKRLLIAALLAATTISAPALAGDVGVPVSGGYPGFYGLLDIGNFPPQQVLYRQPKVVKRGITDHRPKVYVHVSPGHARHWIKRCRENNASGKCVLFVQNK